MADVFLAYARHDRNRVAPVISFLEANGYSVWWDNRLEGGDQWDAVIEREINAAKGIIVAWSGHSINSRWVRAEASLGLDRNILVPILLEAVEPPLSFRLTQAVNLANWRENPNDPEAIELLASVQRVTSKQPTAAPAVASIVRTIRSVVGKRFLVWAAAIVALAISTSFLFPTQFNLARNVATAFVSSEFHLQPQTLRQLQDDSSNLRQFVKASLHTWIDRSTRDDPWSFAQMSVALKFDAAIQSEQVRKHLVGSINNECDCWVGYDGSGHVGVTAWVVRALATRNVPIPEKALARLLERQDAAGWWPIYFDAGTQIRNASVYATAVASWALTAAIRDGVAPASLKDKLLLARNRGFTWLSSVRDSKTGFWTEYPNYQSARPKVALSAAVYAIMTEAEESLKIRDLGNQLVDGFFRLPLDPAYFETTNADVLLATDRRRPDNTKNTFYPWAIIMIAQNRHDLSTLAKAKASHWIELAAQSGLSDQILLQQQWLASETLIALDKLRGAVSGK